MWARVLCEVLTCFKNAGTNYSWGTIDSYDRELILRNFSLS